MPAKTVAPAEVNPLSVCTPLGDRVVIRRDDKPKESTGGILLPDTAYHKTQVGTVIARGPEVESVHLSEGARVVLSAYSGTEMQHGRKPDEYVIVREEDVLGVILDDEGE